MRWLAKEGTSDKHAGSSEESRRIVCTGENMKDVVEESFDGVGMTDFRPEHTVRLDNRYACFADFKIEAS